MTTDLSDAGLKQAAEDAQTFAKFAPVDVESPVADAANLSSWSGVG
jgi:hypothetical protein